MDGRLLLGHRFPRSENLARGLDLRPESLAPPRQVIFVARNGRGEPHIVLLELMQWETEAPAMARRWCSSEGSRSSILPCRPSTPSICAIRTWRLPRTGFRLSPFAFLHNMQRAASFNLRGTAFAGPLRALPLFTGDDEERVTAFLDDALQGGGGMALLPKLVEGDYTPSKRLFDNLGPTRWLRSRACRPRTRR